MSELFIFAMLSVGCLSIILVLCIGTFGSAVERQLEVLLKMIGVLEDMHDTIDAILDEGDDDGDDDIDEDLTPVDRLLNEVMKPKKDKPKN